jgi:glycogen debranching enzyme
MNYAFGQHLIAHGGNGESLEWLVTNGIGGYAAGTVSGLRTRVYHGLLVAAEAPPVGRTMVIPGVDETIIYRGRAYSLASILWRDGTRSPNGSPYIERFCLEDTTPIWRFRLADAILERQIWMVHGTNETRVSYALLHAAEPIALSLKIFISDRDHHATSHGRPDIRTEVTDHGVRCRRSATDSTLVDLSLHRGAPGQSGDPQQDVLASWHVSDDVYANARLRMEGYRGLADIEDLYTGALVRSSLEADETVVLCAAARGDAADSAATDGDAAADSAAPTADPAPKAWVRSPAQRSTELLAAFEATGERARSAPPFVRRLVLAADQFLVDRTLENGETGKTIIAGYPWFGDWGRDTMISYGGITVATGRYHEAAWILRTFADYLDHGMLPNLFPDGTNEPEYNTVDASLWYFEALRQYIEATGDLATAEELFPAIASILHHYRSGTRYGICVDAADNLLRSGEEGVQLTWMDARVGDRVITPRTGKAVEINALWHHALLVTAAIARLLGREHESYADEAAAVAASFQSFWTGAGLADVIDGPAGTDLSLRPNQIFAVSLAGARAADPACRNSPLLDADQSRAVVDATSAALLTPFGLRSLSPEDERYAGHYGGDATERDAHYHQGPVWGWLLGPFVQAHYAVYRDREAGKRLLIPMADGLASGCVGQLSEIYDGDAPHEPRGAFAQAWTVAETLRVWLFLQR